MSKFIEYLKQRETWFAIGSLTLIFLFRLFLMQYRWAIGFDEPHYIQLAAGGMAKGLDYMLHPYWPPMYSASIALFSFIFQDLELSARMVSILSSTLTTIPVYYLTRELYGKKVGTISALAYAFYPSLAFVGTNAMTESSYMFLAISGVALGWFALQKKCIPCMILTGISFGAAYLTKPEGVGFLLVFGAFCGASFIVSKRFEKKNLIVSTVVASLVFLIVAAPYLLYLKNEMGSWTLSMKLQVNQQWEALGWTPDKDLKFVQTLTEDNRVLPTDLAYQSGTFDEVSKDDGGSATEKKVSIPLGLLIHKFMENFYKVNKLGVPIFLTFAPMFFLALGLFRNSWTVKQGGLQLYLLGFIGFFWFIMVPMFHINPRYFLPLLPIAFIWIGNGLYEMTRWGAETFRNIFKDASQKLEGWDSKFGVALAGSFLLIFSYLPEMGKILIRKEHNKNYWSDAVELKKAGLWLKEHVDKEPVLLSYNKAVDYYAGVVDMRTGGSFPLNDDFNDILEYAKNKNAEYLVVSERYSSNFPNLQFLIEKKNVPEALELIYESAEPTGLRTVIYKLKDANFSNGIHD